MQEQKYHVMHIKLLKSLLEYIFVYFDRVLGRAAYDHGDSADT